MNNYFLLNACFVFHFYIISKSWSLNTIILYMLYAIIPKGQIEKSGFFNGLVSYRIGIVLSVSVLYRIVKN